MSAARGTTRLTVEVYILNSVLKYNEDVNDNIKVTYMYIIIRYFVSRLHRFGTLKNIRIAVIVQMTRLTIETVLFPSCLPSLGCKRKKKQKDENRFKPFYLFFGLIFTVCI